MYTNLVIFHNAGHVQDYYVQRVSKKKVHFQCAIDGCYLEEYRHWGCYIEGLWAVTVFTQGGVIKSGICGVLINNILCNTEMRGYYIRDLWCVDCSCYFTIFMDGVITSEICGVLTVVVISQYSGVGLLHQMSVVC